MKATRINHESFDRFYIMFHGKDYTVFETKELEDKDTKEKYTKDVEHKKYFNTIFGAALYINGILSADGVETDLKGHLKKLMPDIDMINSLRHFKTF